MLESSCLRLCPWADTPHSSAGLPTAPCRDIVHGATNSRLGFVYRRPTRLPFLKPIALELYEGDDASYLCSVRRSWCLPFGWRVRDAEDKVVGSISGSWILDAGDRPVAFLRHASAAKVSFCGIDGAEWAELTRQDGGGVFTFTGVPDDNPFLRMLLLAAAVLQADRGP
ncbi:MAG: hypothetical protein NZ700_13310 [Gemmataceae bacterium]|nr:hypothetical protein [Gemmataceae bacterium]MDW8265715.1 hypothetical protein [Gemmataceae bacterium]